MSLLVSFSYTYCYITVTSKLQNLDIFTHVCTYSTSIILLWKGWFPGRSIPKLQILEVEVITVFVLVLVYFELMTHNWYKHHKKNIKTAMIPSYFYLKHSNLWLVTSTSGQTRDITWLTMLYQQLWSSSAFAQPPTIFEAVPSLLAWFPVPMPFAPRCLLHSLLFPWIHWPCAPEVVECRMCNFMEHATIVSKSIYRTSQ